MAERNRLVEAHIQMVTPIANHYGRCSRESQEDLRQVGLLGLIRAAELFDAQHGTPFAAFARPHIRGAILHHLRDIAPAVRLPRRQAELQERLLQFERSMRQSSVAEGRRVGSERLGLSADQWTILMRQRQLNRPESLADLMVETDLRRPGDDDCELTSLEPDARSADELLAWLEPRQRQVVRQVVLHGLSYRQIARRMQVSPMTVQRLLRRGLQQLRLQIDADGITPGISPDRERSVARAC